MSPRMFLVMWLLVSFLCAMLPVIWWVAREMYRDVTQTRALRESQQKREADSRRYVDDEALR